MTVFLDGGMGQALRARGLNTDARSSAQALIDSPTAVRDVHQEYIAAGADVITTWNYTVTPQRLAQIGLRDRLGEITRLAVAMAEAGRAEAGKAGLHIAGSLPPLRASYEPNAQDPASMVEEYAEISGHLSPGVDLFLCETMSSAAEAAAAARAAARHGKPVWVSWGPCGTSATASCAAARRWRRPWQPWTASRSRRCSSTAAMPMPSPRRCRACGP